MNDLISEYQHYLVSEKMKSENTVHSYVSDLQNYIYYLNEKQGIDDIRDVDTKTIQKYLAYWHSIQCFLVDHIALFAAYAIH